MSQARVIGEVRSLTPKTGTYEGRAYSFTIARVLCAPFGDDFAEVTIDDGLPVPAVGQNVDLLVTVSTRGRLSVRNVLAAEAVGAPAA